MSKKEPLKFSMSYPIRRPDKIISSDARVAGDVYGFTVDYESDPYVYLDYLLQDEYYRRWFAQRDEYARIMLSMAAMVAEGNKIKRRTVTRDRRKKVREKVIPIIPYRPKKKGEEGKKEEVKKEEVKKEEVKKEEVKPKEEVQRGPGGLRCCPQVKKC